MDKIALASSAIVDLFFSLNSLQCIVKSLGFETEHLILQHLSTKVLDMTDSLYSLHKCIHIIHMTELDRSRRAFGEIRLALPVL